MKERIRWVAKPSPSWLAQSLELLLLLHGLRLRNMPLRLCILRRQFSWTRTLASSAKASKERMAPSTPNKPSNDSRDLQCQFFIFQNLLILNFAFPFMTDTSFYFMRKNNDDFIMGGVSILSSSDVGSDLVWGT